MKYEVGFDIPFVFVYVAMSLDKEQRRNNFIYALKMLESLRTHTLILLGINLELFDNTLKQNYFIL